MNYYFSFKHLTKHPKASHIHTLKKTLLSMTISSILSAADENDRTLCFIHAKDYSNALASSLSALTNFRGKIDIAMMSPCLQTTAALDQCMMLSPAFHTDDCAATDKFIYNHGISIPQAVTDPAVIVPVLIFNSALAHHLAAKSVEELLNAERLYKYAYGSAHCACGNSLFWFAVINNVSVILRDIGNIKQSERNFQHLLKIFTIFVDQRSTERLRKVQGFLVNIPWNVGSVASPAA